MEPYILNLIGLFVLLEKSLLFGFGDSFGSLGCVAMETCVFYLSLY